ncbi:MAG: alpha/beta hydrolase [Pseudomonadota bacterium]
MATTVYFGTNREVKRVNPPELGNDFNSDGPRFYRVGKALVEKIGDNWALGGEGYKTISAELYDERRPSKSNPAGKPGSTAMFEEMRGVMATETRDVLVFIHGFASTFESAMERAAALADAYLSAPTDAEGTLSAERKEPLVFAFSWPSDAEMFVDDDRGWAYSGDRVQAKESGHAMARCAMRMLEFLIALKREERCEQRLHLVAHSMGNWALRAAVQEMVEIAEEEGILLRPVFENVFLMAADIEDHALEQEGWLAPVLMLTRRVHVYHAENDKALTASVLKPNQGARLGHLGPRRMSVLPDRVSAVDCRDVSWTPADKLVRHQYYRLAPEVIEDVRSVLAGIAPSDMATRVPGDAPGRWRVKLDTAAREALRRTADT